MRLIFCSRPACASAATALVTSCPTTPGTVTFGIPVETTRVTVDVLLIFVPPARILARHLTRRHGLVGRYWKRAVSPTSSIFVRARSFCSLVTSGTATGFESFSCSWIFV